MLANAEIKVAALERFVFVMSILEGYSIPECSILLNCTKQEVTTAQARALQQMALAGINPPTSVPGTEDSFDANRWLEGSLAHAEDRPRLDAVLRST